MSIRSITVQYVGNVLFLPKLERDVKLVVERDYGTADPDKQFVMERTCQNKAPKYLDFLCSECGFVHYIDDSNCTGDGNEWNYCPSCGAKVVGE